MPKRYSRAFDLYELFQAVMLFIGAIMLFFALATLRALAGAWLLMLGFMYLNEVWGTVPALGFWQILLPSLFFGWWIALNSYQSSSSNKD